MVSYGNDEFRTWAEEAGFNDDDLALMKRTVTRRKRIWFLLYLAGCGLGAGIIAPLSPELAEIIGGFLSAFMFFALPFFLESWVFARVLKYGSFDVKPNFIWSILYLVMLVSFVCIFPIFIWRGCKNKQWGTGINGLLKKGLIGNH